jgi:hypothetical protein
MSEFLKLNRKRFASGFQDIPGDRVPWELDDKVNAYEFVSGLGYRVPASLVFATITEALEAEETRFVVKGSGGHSSKRVFVLERLDGERFLDLMRLRVWSKDQLVAEAAKTSAKYWIREECVTSAIYGRPVPLDYKVDCFGGAIVSITQIDRNFWPPRVAIFDGAFVPLSQGIDYALNHERWLPAWPVLPLYASAMVSMARHLSTSTGSRYVRVDCFDTADGPVFGEFTFASGPPSVGMVRFSDRMLAKFDAALCGARCEQISGFDIDYEGYWAETDKDHTPISSQPPDLIGRLNAAATFGDRRYRSQMEIAPKGAMGRHYSFCVALAATMAGDRQQLFLIQEAIRVSAGFLCGKSREQEFVEQATNYHETNRHLGPWHDARLAEIMASRGDDNAMLRLKALAEGGYDYAKGALERLSCEANTSMRQS